LLGKELDQLKYKLEREWGINYCSSNGFWCPNKHNSIDREIILYMQGYGFEYGFFC
jgi:hypothetical protein